jgi:hypothetical protein
VGLGLVDVFASVELPLFCNIRKECCLYFFGFSVFLSFLYFPKDYVRFKRSFCACVISKSYTVVDNALFFSFFFFLYAGSDNLLVGIDPIQAF